MTRSVVSVTLYESDLRAANACGSGMDLYRSLLEAQGGVYVVVRRADGTRLVRHRTDRVKLRLCLLAQLWLARDCEHAGWLREKGMILPVFAPYANLYGADLRGANLYGANLRGASLSSADLRGANLYGANLYGANLRGADLYGANLYGADLRGASLSSADLRGANLYGANLYGANLRGADLRGARRFSSDACPEGWVYRDGVLARAVAQ